MARVLLITTDFPPLNTVAARRMYAWAHYLHDAGHDVFIVTNAKKSASEEKNYMADVSSLSIIETRYWDIKKFLLRIVADKEKRVLHDLYAAEQGGLGKCLCFLMRRGIVLSSLRIPNFLDLWIFSAVRAGARIIRSQRIDCIITSYSPPAAHLAGLCLKMKFGRRVRWIADFRDLWFENHLAKGLFPFSFFEKILEGMCVRRADGLTTVSGVLKEKLLLRFPLSNIRVVENGYDEALSGELPVDSWRRNTKRIVYAGTLYERSDPGALADLLSDMQHNDPAVLSGLEIIFYGNHRTASYITMILKKYPGLRSCIAYGGFKSPEEIQTQLIQADALLFLEQDHPYDGVLTGKIFEYMHARKPVLCVGVGEHSYVGKFLGRSGVCFLCGNDMNRVRDFIMKLRFGTVAITPDEDYIGRFSRKAGSQKLESFMRSCLCKRA